MLLALTLLSIGAAASFAVLWWRLQRDERQRSSARVAALAAAIDGTGLSSSSSAAGGMFSPEHSAAAQGTPIVRLAAGIVTAVIIILAVAANRAGNDAGSSTAAPAAAPIELLSMRHTRDGATLTVSGLVRNPRGAGDVSRVTAVVFAFDRAGSFVASGRAPLDFTTLEPGDESPFVVTVPNAADVGRYRVSFRTGEGAVRHVDRRAEQARLAAADLK